MESKNSSPVSLSTSRKQWNFISNKEIITEYGIPIFGCFLCTYIYEYMIKLSPLFQYRRYLWIYDQTYTIVPVSEIFMNRWSNFHHCSSIGDIYEYMIKLSPLFQYRRWWIVRTCVGWWLWAHGERLYTVHETNLWRCSLYALS